MERTTGSQELKKSTDSGSLLFENTRLWSHLTVGEPMGLVIDVAFFIGV
jgi:hypothetical protein